MSHPLGENDTAPAPGDHAALPSSSMSGIPDMLVDRLRITMPSCWCSKSGILVHEVVAEHVINTYKILNFNNL